MIPEIDWTEIEYVMEDIFWYDGPILGPGVYKGKSIFFFNQDRGPEEWTYDIYLYNDKLKELYDSDKLMDLEDTVGFFEKECELIAIAKG